MDLKRKLLFARLAKKAYDDIHHEGLRDGWTHIKSFKNEKTDAQAFIAISGKEIAISVKGTSSVKDALQDAKIRLVKAVFGGKRAKVEKGFFEDYESLKARIVDEVRLIRKNLPDATVVVTGHSLGAAIATLLRAELWAQGIASSAHTFGSPEPGNRGFARLYRRQGGETVRVVHERDIVPTLPLWFRFTHVCPPFHMDDQGQSIPAPSSFWRKLKAFFKLVKSRLDGEALKDHFIDNYIVSLEKGIALQATKPG